MGKDVRMQEFDTSKIARYLNIVIMGYRLHIEQFAANDPRLTPDIVEAFNEMFDKQYAVLAQAQSQPLHSQPTEYDYPDDETINVPLTTDEAAEDTGYEILGRFFDHSLLQQESFLNIAIGKASIRRKIV